MIVDSSVLIAILRSEPDAPMYTDAIEAAPSRRISAATFLETAIVVDQSDNPILSRRLDFLLEEAMFTIEPVTEKQARIAREAYRDFGKGTGHPAGLNFGDCLSYALAKDLDEPLLFKGGDFEHTDVKNARMSRD